MPGFAAWTRANLRPDWPTQILLVLTMLTPLVSVSLAGRVWYCRPGLSRRLRLVHKSPPASPGATHARTLLLRYLAQTTPTTFTPLMASYDCPMKYRAFSWSNVVKAADNCLTLNFASVCFPPKIEGFLPEGNTLFTQVNRSSDTLPFAISDPETTACLLPYFLHTGLELGDLRGVARW